MKEQLNKTRIRAYARLLETGIRTIDEIDAVYRVATYVELISTGKMTLEEVDSRYRDIVKEVLLG